MHVKEISASLKRYLRLPYANSKDLSSKIEEEITNEFAGKIEDVKVELRSLEGYRRYNVSWCEEGERWGASILILEGEDVDLS